MLINRKRKTKNPCHICGFSKGFAENDSSAILCLCHEIKKKNSQTKLLLIIHYKELKRTTNSGKLAVAALENSELLIRGLIDKPLDLTSHLDSSSEKKYESLLFFPSSESHELTTEFISQFSKPIQLIVPDGNWRQASKVASRHKELASLPKVMIAHENKAEYHLRKETSPCGMSTLEAIARAFEIIDSHEVGNYLMKLYQLKLQKTLLGRGIKS